MNAEFVYGNKADKTMLEEAVRWVIIVLVIVFDPLAVALLVAWSHLVIIDRPKQTISKSAHVKKKKVMFEVPDDAKVKVNDKKEKSIIIAGHEYTEKQISGILASNFDDLPDDQKTVFNKFVKKNAGAKSSPG